ncbi:MAG TPA: class I SAM-dependent methyltransferase [Verrucomicrobiae bacterium]|nr:class I SAM-dependent methyltransferase [Verrucomicrobiae bacterium]
MAAPSPPGDNPLGLARELARRVILGAFAAHAGLIDLLKKEVPIAPDLKELAEVQERARPRTDISDHLVTLFTESLPLRPKLIVELGVRGGESTFVFERVARLCGSDLLSLDLDDCSAVINYDKWHFVRADDVEFAGRFAEWCRSRGIEPAIDVLFIDTSHIYEHTLAEIRAWFPLVGPRGKVFFHDTNQRHIYRRRDGSFGLAWTNDRGVIRALEDYFQHPFNEGVNFTDTRDGWLIEHHAYCSGMTMLTRVPTGK